MRVIVLIFRHDAIKSNNRQISNIRRIESQNINVSPLVLHFSLANLLKPCVKFENHFIILYTGTANLATHTIFSDVSTDVSASGARQIQCFFV